MTPVTEIGMVPLEFWLGPVRLMRVWLRVIIENFQPEPGQAASPPAPNMHELPRGVRGLYRRSQPADSEVQPLPRFIRYVTARYDRRLISLRQSFDDYIRRLSRKARTRLKGEVRRFAEAAGGNIAWRSYGTSNEIQEFYCLARDVSRHTYQEKLFDVGMPADAEFLERLCRLAEADRVRGYILFWDDLPISYIYCRAVGSRLYLDRLGFRPEFAKHSPGTVLQFLAIESLFAEQKFELFDFGEGGEGLHKRAFASHTVPCANVLYLKRTAINAAIVVSHQSWTRFSKGVVDVTEQIGIKRRLRRWLRGQQSSGDAARLRAKRL